MTVEWFYYIGHNWSRCALGLSLICDPEAPEYAVAVFLGPILFMCGWESPAHCHGVSDEPGM